MSNFDGSKFSAGIQQDFNHFVQSFHDKLLRFEQTIEHERHLFDSDKREAQLEIERDRSELEKEWQKLEREKQKFRKELIRMQKENKIQTEQIKLDVGGKYFATSIATLTEREPESMLAAMFSGRYTLIRNEEGRIFIDRNGKYFSIILDWLRDGEIDIPDDSYLLKKLEREANYFGLLNLLNVLKNGFEDSRGTRFEFSGSDYDDRGILFWLGSSRGMLPWKNPHPEHVTVMASSIGLLGCLSEITSNQIGQFYTYNLPGSWVQLRFNSIKIKPTDYTFGCPMINNIPRNWELQGSNDGMNWNTIRKHADDRSITPHHKSNTWRVDCNQFYSYFRVLSTGPDSDGQNFLVVSGIEIYGFVIDSKDN